MQAIVVRDFGAAEQLTSQTRPDPVAGPGQAVIAVEAAGVGLVDLLQRRGHLGLAAPGYIPGLEVAGRIVAVGEGVDPAWMGQRVFAWGQGGYAQRFVAPASALVPLPDDVSAEAAVALGINGLVAQFSLERVGLKPGERILVRGASGGIGATVAQLAAAAGARVTAISSARHAAAVATLGVETVLHRGHGALPEGPFDVIIDPVAGEAMPSLVQTLAPNGRYLVNGAAGGFPPPGIADIMLQHFPKSLTYALFSLDSVPDEDRVKAASRLFAQAAEGQLRPLIGAVLPLGEAARAHKLLEAGDSFGKVVLQPEPDPQG